MLKLGIHHHETIVALVKHGSMKDAAAELSTTASALSHRLAEAERRLGAPLFTRGAGKRVRPTAGGRAFADRASHALAELERSETAYLSAEGSARPVVRIGVGGYDAYHWFGTLLATVDSADIGVSLDLVLVGDSPASRLAAGEVDIVIAPGVPSGPLQARHLFSDELGLITHPDHPLAQRSFVEPADLVSERYLTYSRTSWPGFEYDQFIRPADLHPLVVTVIEQTSTIVEMVAAASAISILSRWALAHAISTDRVACIQCGPHGLPMEWHCLTRPNDNVPGVADVSDLLLTVLGPD